MSVQTSVHKSGVPKLVGRRAPLPLINKIVAAFVFFLIARPVEVLGLVQSLAIGNILVLCALFGLLVQWKKIQPVQIGKSFVTHAAVMMLVFGWLSILYSVWRWETMQFLTSTGAVLPVLFFAVAVACTSSDIVFAYLRTIAWSTLFLAVAIVIDHNTGRAAVNGAYDTNDVALVMVGGMPFVFLMALRSKGLKRLFLFGGLVAQVTAILLTQSRGGLLGLGAAVFLLWTNSPSSGRSGTAKKIGFACGIGLVGVVVWSILPPDAQERLNFFGTLGEDYNIDDPNGRLNIWKLGLATLLENPWGIGAGSFETAIGSAYGVYKAPHSSYLQAAVELGVIPGILYIVMWWRSFRLGGRVDRAVQKLTDDQRWASLANFGWVWRSSVVGLAVSAAFLSQAYSYLIFSLFAMTAALEAQLFLASATKLRGLAARPAAQQQPAHRAS